MALRSEYSGAELGALLRERRASLKLSLDQMHRRTQLAVSTLSRYETGGRIPVERAGLLDRAYQGQGVIASAIVASAAKTWTPAEDERPRRIHVHRWPAAHEGAVWVQILPTRTRVGRPHQVRLSWGPWQRAIVFERLDAFGATVWTAKGRDDGAGAHLNCEVDVPVHVLFGLNDPPAHAIDVRDGWTLIVGLLAN